MRLLANCYLENKKPWIYFYNSEGRTRQNRWWVRYLILILYNCTLCISTWGTIFRRSPYILLDKWYSPSNGMSLRRIIILLQLKLMKQITSGQSSWLVSYKNICQINEFLLRRKRAVPLNKNDIFRLNI